MNERETLLSIIVPTFNEEKGIGDVVGAIQALELPQTEILVIDDGSTDETAHMASAAGARVISHPYNIGNGAAVKTGIRSARGRVVVFLDGDGQHDPRDIPRLLTFIPQYHMVVGARQKGSQTSKHRDAANWVYNRFASFLASFTIEDLTSGFRAMRRQDALRFCDMFPNRFSYPTTSTLAFIRSGRSVRYVPITTRARSGTSKIRLLHDGVEFFVIILKIAMMYSPLRVFLPVSSFLFFLGLARYAYTYLTEHTFTNMAHLLINSSVIVFLLGLIAEQIASLRLERGDKLFEAEDSRQYAPFVDFGGKGSDSAGLFTEH
jgi:glycosyltransferase involved in cell wall biosynthesis